MVNLTNVAAFKFYPTLEKKAGDILGRKGFGRLPIADKAVKYVEVAPLALKNSVSNRSTKDRQKVCMNQMMELIACMSKYDQNQSMCEKEKDALSSCYKSFVSKQKALEAQKTEELPLGQRAKMTGPEMTKYMKKFQQSSTPKHGHTEKVLKEHFKYLN